VWRGHRSITAYATYIVDPQRVVNMSVRYMSRARSSSKSKQLQVGRGGLRITAYDILEYPASGMSEAEILADFPELTSDDIRSCLAFAADRERRRLCVPAD